MSKKRATKPKVARTTKSARRATSKPRTAKKVAVPNRPTPWEDFSWRYARHPVLESDTIYALPEGLVDAIACEIPDFFTEKDREFERDLSLIAGVGFFLRHPIACPSLVRPSSNPIDSKDPNIQRWKASDARIRQMLVEGMQEAGAVKATLRSCLRTKNSSQKRLLNVRRATLDG